MAWAVHEFIRGPLLAESRRLGKPLLAPLDCAFSARRGSFRVLYEIDEQNRTVTVTAVRRRDDVYRPR